jgi:hypothetical protein
LQAFASTFHIAGVHASPGKTGSQQITTNKRAWTKQDHRTLKAHSKARTPVVKISKQMKRTVGALRQQALKLGIGLGHQQRVLCSTQHSAMS